MKILLIKMSSMGDIFHTFPAITDLKTQFPDAIVDWVVEEGFKEIVSWHPGVRRAIPIGLRRWVKARDRKSWRELKAFRHELRAEDYDLIIDAQGLLKSILVAKFVNAKVIHGFDKHSAREPLASFFIPTNIQ